MGWVGFDVYIFMEVFGVIFNENVVDEFWYFFCFWCLFELGVVFVLFLLDCDYFGVVDCGLLYVLVVGFCYCCFVGDGLFEMVV